MLILHWNRLEPTKVRISTSYEDALERTVIMYMHDISNLFRFYRSHKKSIGSRKIEITFDMLVLQ